MAQACGRFRNGMMEIDHYVVFNPKIEFKDREEVEEYIKGIEKAYKQLSKIYDSSHSTVEKRAILNSIKNIPFSEIFIDGEMDYFLKDNMINTEMLKSLYTDYFTLRDAYGKSKYFQVPFEMDPVNFWFEDKKSKVNYKKESGSKFKLEQNKAIIETMEVISQYSGTTEISQIINNFKSHNKILVDAFFKLGSEFIKNVDYSMKKIKDALVNKKLKKNGYNEYFLEALYSTFIIGKKYSWKEAKKKLQKLYDKFNITPPSKITAQSLKWHFEVRDTARIGDSKAIEILSPKLKNPD